MSRCCGRRRRTPRLPSAPRLPSSGRSRSTAIPHSIPGCCRAWWPDSTAAADLSIDAVALARRANSAGVLEAVAPRRRRQGRRVLTASGRSWPGTSRRSTSAPACWEGSARRRRARPLRPARSRTCRGPLNLDRAGAQRSARGAPFRLLVVGAGAGGVELALCCEARLSAETRRPVRRHAARSRRTRSFRAPLRLSFDARRARLRRRGVPLDPRRRGRGARRERRVSGGGPDSRPTRSIWSPGPAAHAFLRESGLPVDEGGFVRVDSTLPGRGRGPALRGRRLREPAGMKKAGVYAVRSGPILAENLRRVAEPASPCASIDRSADSCHS